MNAAAGPQPVAFAAADGRHLAGLLVHAARPHGALVVNNATGYLREFYLRFARYAAERGYHTLVYDYRGMGASRSGSLRAETARMSDWGRLDMPAALDFLCDSCPGLPAFTLGHSVGGQLIGAMENANRARAHVMIAASTGYWRRQSVPFRYLALAFWKLYGPLTLRTHGYVPRSPLWRGQPLPPRVFLQWRAWCLSPKQYGPALDLALAGTHFDRVRGPLLVWGFTDDPIATPAAIEALLPSYAGAQLERRSTTPGEIGARGLGHHGFFAQAHRESLWRAALDWLDSRV